MIWAGLRNYIFFLTLITLESFCLFLLPTSGTIRSLPMWFLIYNTLFSETLHLALQILSHHVSPLQTLPSPTLYNHNVEHTVLLHNTYTYISRSFFSLFPSHLSLLYNIRAGKEWITRDLPQVIAQNTL